MLGEQVALGYAATMCDMAGKPLGQFIREARLRAHLSQQRLAGIANTTNDAIWKIESGRRSPEWPLLARLLVALSAELSGEDIVRAAAHERTQGDAEDRASAHGPPRRTSARQRKQAV